MPGDIEVQDTPALMGMMKKQYKRPKVTLGTAKKSTAAIASRWLCRKVRQRGAASLSLGARLIQRETVRSETSKPTINGSP
jgi:hypothetical protein